MQEQLQQPQEPQPQPAPVQNKKKNKRLEYRSKDNKQGDKPKKPREQKIQQPLNLDVQEEILIFEFVRSVIELRVNDFKFHILGLRVTEDMIVGLKSILASNLRNSKPSFQEFIKMVILIFQYQTPTTPSIETKLAAILDELRKYDKERYKLNEEVNKSIVSQFKRIPNDKIADYIRFWGFGFVKNNKKIVEQLMDCFLYSDDKYQRFTGLMIVLKVLGVNLPEIEYTIKIVAESIKHIDTGLIDYLLYRYEDDMEYILCEIRKIKTQHSDRLSQHIKTCQKYGFTINGQKIKPKISPQQAIQRGLQYNFKHNSFDAFENKFRDRVEYHAKIAQILFQHQKTKGMYFVQKYKLQEHQLISKLYHKHISTHFHYEAKTYKNTLETHDDFKPTQNVLFSQEEAAIEYLSFSHFGLKQADVVFISEVNEALQQAELTLSKASIIGFDVQSSGGICFNDNMVQQTLQIATPNKIYIFDIPKLKGQKAFTSLLLKLFCDVNDQVVLGFAYHGNDEKALRKMLPNQKKLEFKPVIDIQNQNSVRKGVGLKDLVEKVFEKRLSKFEQCSGWNNRPLRKAQLHYAALDSYVLIEIYNRTPKLEQ